MQSWLTLNAFNGGQLYAITHHTRITRIKLRLKHNIGSSHRSNGNPSQRLTMLNNEFLMLLRWCSLIQTIVRESASMISSALKLCERNIAIKRCLTTQTHLKMFGFVIASLKQCKSWDVVRSSSVSESCKQWKIAVRKINNSANWKYRTKNNEMNSASRFSHAFQWMRYGISIVHSTFYLTWKY